MNKLLLLILILGLIVFYCLNFNLENFRWAWGYYPKFSLNNKTKELPIGSWRDKCIIQDFREPMLWASCEDDHGKHIEASIDITKCIDRKIRNVNGVLECD